METFNAMIDKLTPLFNSIAAKIGEGAQWGWGVMIRQEYVTAVDDFIWAIFALIATIVLIWGAKRFYKAFLEDDDWMPGIVVCTILAAIAAAVFFGLMDDGIQHIVNPSYFAIKDVASFITGNNNSSN